MIRKGAEADPEVCHVWPLLMTVFSGVRSVCGADADDGTHYEGSRRPSPGAYAAPFDLITALHPSRFRFPVPLLGDSARAWVSIHSLILQSRVRPGTGEAQAQPLFPRS